MAAGANDIDTPGPLAGGGPPLTIRRAVEKNALAGTLLLVTLPGSSALTQRPCAAFTVIASAQVECAASEPPLNENELLPAGALMLPPQVVVAGVALLKIPPG